MTGTGGVGSIRKRGCRVGDISPSEGFGDEFLRETILGAQTHEAVEVAERHARFIGRTQSCG